MPNGPQAAQDSASGKMKANYQLKKEAESNPFAWAGQVGRAAAVDKKMREYMTSAQKGQLTKQMKAAASKSAAGVGANAKLMEKFARKSTKIMGEGAAKRSLGGLKKESRRWQKAGESLAA